MPADPDTDGELAAAYAELQRLLLDGLELVDFLQRVAQLATSVVPATSCGIVMRREAEIATLATSDEMAAQVDEIFSGADTGPCREALRTGAVVRVDDLAADVRWDRYRSHALECGVRSSMSIPLVVNGAVLGVLNIYSPNIKGFPPPATRRAEAYARQAAVTLTIALRSFNRSVVESQLRAALATRAVIDQALGILMAQRRIGAREAFAGLRQMSQTRNVPVRVAAAELVEAVTGRPPEPPRPFAEPR